MGEIGDAHVLDAALAAAAQAVEHYEISRYSTLIALAKQLGHKDVVQPLQDTLAEEKATDVKLSKLVDSVEFRKAAITRFPTISRAIRGARACLVPPYLMAQIEYLDFLPRVPPYNREAPLEHGRELPEKTPCKDYSGLFDDFFRHANPLGKNPNKILTRICVNRLCVRLPKPIVFHERTDDTADPKVRPER